MTNITSLNIHSSSYAAEIDETEVGQLLLNLPANEKVRDRAAQVLVSTRLEIPNTPSQAVVAATVAEVRDDGNVMIFYHRLGANRSRCRVVFDVLIIEP